MTYSSPLQAHNLWHDVRIAYQTDDYHQPRIVVSGFDREHVYSRALDEKNARPLFECPQITDVKRDEKSGLWSVVVITHRPRFRLNLED